VAKEHAHGHGRTTRKDERSVIGSESVEPGKPTRRIDEGNQRESPEIAEIARQQGATQRGFSADGDGGDANRGSPPGGVEGVHR
jgi:hypothetical protein